LLSFERASDIFAAQLAVLVGIGLVQTAVSPATPSPLPGDRAVTFTSTVLNSGSAFAMVSAVCAGRRHMLRNS
jgi:hypothetical protein